MPKVIAQFWMYILQIIGVSLFFGLGLLSTIIIQLLKPRTPRMIAASRAGILKLLRLYVWWLQVTKLVRINLHALKPLSQCHGTIIVANHPSLLDAIYLLTSIPSVFCVMRADLKFHPSIAGGASMYNFITNDSGGAFIREAVKRLRNGENLLIFPEGTRTPRNRCINPFKKGFALAALKSGAPIKTILIKQNGIFLRCGVSLIAPAKFPIHVEFKLGDTFLPLHGESATQFTYRIEAYFHQNLSLLFN